MRALDGYQSQRKFGALLCVERLTFPSFGNLSDNYHYKTNHNNMANQLRCVYRTQRFQRNQKWWWVLFIWGYEVSILEVGQMDIYIFQYVFKFFNVSRFAYRHGISVCVSQTLTIFGITPFLFMVCPEFLFIPMYSRE